MVTYNVIWQERLAKGETMTTIIAARIEQAPQEIQVLTKNQIIDVVKDFPTNLPDGLDNGAVLGAARRWVSRTRELLTSAEYLFCDFLGILDFSQLMCLVIDLSFGRPEIIQAFERELKGIDGSYVSGELVAFLRTTLNIFPSG